MLHLFSLGIDQKSLVSSGSKTVKGLSIPTGGQQRFLFLLYVPLRCVHSLYLPLELFLYKPHIGGVNARLRGADTLLLPIEQFPLTVILSFDEKGKSIFFLLQDPLRLGQFEFFSLFMLPPKIQYLLEIKPKQIAIPS